MSTQSDPNETSDYAPDPSESYERAHPKREPGLGEVDTPKRVRDDRDDNAKDSTHNPKKHGEMTGEDDRQGGDAVDPSDKTAHGDRSDPAHGKKEEEA